MELISKTVNYIKEREVLKYADVVKPSLSFAHAKLNLLYVVYRCVQFVLHLLILLGAVLELHKTTKTRPSTHDATFLLYLTSWVLISNVVQSLLGAVAVAKAYVHYARGGTIMTEGNDRIYTVPKRFLWTYSVMHSVAVNFSVFMVFGYWELMGSLPKGPTHENKVEFAWYGISAFLMFLDHMVVRFSYKMFTGVYSLSIMVAYLTMTWVHFRNGSVETHKPKHYIHIGAADLSKHYSYIYPGLDWSKPSIAASHALWSVFLLEVVNCSTLWWTSQLKKYVRLKMHAKLHAVAQEDAMNDEPFRHGTPMSQTPQQVESPTTEGLPPPNEPHVEKQSVQEPHTEKKHSKKKKA